MSLMSIFLLLVLILVLLFVGAIKILNTSAGRIFLINSKIRQEEKERKKEISNLQKLTLDQVKNPDEFLQLILKMKMGERVDIPLAAFSYIYKNLDSFTIFDKDGNLTIINKDKYFEFKEKASNLIKDNNADDKEKIEDIINKEKKKIATDPIEIIEYKDGTFIKKDYVARTIEIKKINNEKILINMDDDSVILENIENIEIDNKKIDKKEFAKQEQKKEKDAKEIKQKLKLLEHEKSEVEKELKAERTKNKEDKDELDSAMGNVQNQEKNPFSNEDKVKEKELDIEKTEVAENIEKTKIAKNIKLNTKIKHNEEKENKKEKELAKVKLTFNSDLTHFSSQIKHTLIADIIQFIVLCNTDSCRKLVVYDTNVDCILINTNWFAYRLSLLISDETERETFLNTIFTNKQKGFIDNDFLGKIIEKINHAGSYRFGAVILSQEKKDKKIINFRSAKILDQKNKKLYQGTFLYMFMRNDIFKNSLNKNKELDFIFDNECSVEITDENGAKISYEDICEISV